MATVLRPLTVESSVTEMHVQLAGDAITVTWFDDVAPQRVRSPATRTGICTSHSNSRARGVSTSHVHNRAGGPYEPCA